MSASCSQRLKQPLREVLGFGFEPQSAGRGDPDLPPGLGGDIALLDPTSLHFIVTPTQGGGGDRESLISMY